MPHDVVFTCNVVQGERDQDPVIVINPQLDYARYGVRHDMFVGVQRTLWSPCGAGREEHAHHIFFPNMKPGFLFLTF